MNSGPGTRLLEQPTRRRIFEHLTLLPGDHLRSIIRTLHISLGAGRHHLVVLTREGLVRSERMGSRLRYFAVPVGDAIPLNDTFKEYWKYRDLRMRILSAVIRLAEARPSTVAASLGVSRQLAAYHLNRLAELGLVVRSRGRYRAADPANWDLGVARRPGEGMGESGEP
jgi:predicted transcriptional regulator